MISTKVVKKAQQKLEESLGPILIEFAIRDRVTPSLFVLKVRRFPKPRRVLLEFLGESFEEVADQFVDHAQKL